ncbi:helix-turn-helix domain-containing protein [Streptomyces bacillaris]
MPKDAAVDEFAGLVRTLKARDGRSYEALGRRLSVSASTLHRYCSGATVPEEFAVIDRLARLCGANEEERRALQAAWTEAERARRRAASPAPPPVPAMSAAPESNPEPSAPEPGPGPVRPGPVCAGGAPRPPPSRRPRYPPRHRRRRPRRARPRRPARPPHP